MNECQCTFNQRMTGDGCRYCNPQDHIDNLVMWLEDERKDSEELDELIQPLITFLKYAMSQCIQNKEWTAIGIKDKALELGLLIDKGDGVYGYSEALKKVYREPVP